MEIIILISLLAAALLLFILELFVLPGLSISGIASAAFYLYSIFYAFTEIGSTAGYITIGVSLFSIVLCLWWMARSKTIDRLSMKTTMADIPTSAQSLGLNVGDKGTTITRLSVIGNASFGTLPVEVYSTEGFIDEGTPIEIVRIEGANIYVKRQ